MRPAPFAVLPTRRNLRILFCRSFSTNGKRLSDVFDDEFAAQSSLYGDAETAHTVLQADHADALKHNRRAIVRFYIPQEYA